MRKQQGFTLIELMVVVAIIGILLTIAIPSYQQYAIRARITEGLNLAESAKTAVAETYQTTGSFPSSNSAAGLPATIESPMVSNMQVGTDGVITITYNAGTVGLEAAQNTILLTPTTSTSAITWSCSTGTTVLNTYLPANCRTTGGADTPAAE